MRAYVEHPFLHIKRLLGDAKTRYRGLAKNANRLIAMCALYNVRRAGIVLSGWMRSERAKEPEKRPKTSCSRLISARFSHFSAQQIPMLIALRLARLDQRFPR